MFDMGGVLYKRNERAEPVIVWIYKNTSAERSVH